jgi:plastocyanin
MKTGKFSTVIVLAAVISLCACTHMQAPVSAESAGRVIDMTASDFKFEPNNITARVGTAITFRINNTSGITHNFTLKGPDGENMKSIDIPARESVEVHAAFAKPGTYKFKCDKTGHSELGMQGQVVVSE